VRWGCSTSSRSASCAKGRTENYLTVTRGLDQTLEHFLHGQLSGNRQHRVADRLQRWTQPLRHRQHDSFAAVPRIWLWTQVAILVFVLAGMAIAITKLA
jgi:hypothetical protein